MGVRPSKIARVSPHPPRSADAAADLRARLHAAVFSPVAGCFAEARESGPVNRADHHHVLQSRSPLVACGRHKAVDIAAEIHALAGHEEAALTRLAAARDSALREGVVETPDVLQSYDALEAEVLTAAAVKRAALETEAIAADIAIELAIAVCASLTEVGVFICVVRVHSETQLCQSRPRAAVIILPETHHHCGR